MVTLATLAFPAQQGDINETTGQQSAKQFLEAVSHTRLEGDSEIRSGGQDQIPEASSGQINHVSGCAQHVTR